MEFSECDKFIVASIASSLKDSDNEMQKNVKDIFVHSFDTIHKIVRQASMINLEKWVIPYLMGIIKSEAADFFIDYISLPENCEGIKYSETLLGEFHKTA